jgi:hypothetical protein
LLRLLIAFQSQVCKRECRTITRILESGTQIDGVLAPDKNQNEEEIMLTVRLVCALALPAGILLGSLGAASAQGSESVRDACTPDAMRLCNEFIPDEGKVRACMLRQRSQLSEACRLAMRGRSAEGERGARRHHRHHRDD